MRKKSILEEGQIYAIPLTDGSYTISQLVNHHKINTRASENTFAFFNYKFLSLEEVKDVLDMLDLSNPFAIVSLNSKPKAYDWELLCKKEIVVKFKYKDDISSLGFFKNLSTDPSIFLEPYFGLFPWDGYFKDDYLDKYMLPNAQIRDDIKYLKDFTTDELKKMLPEDSPKLIKRLEEEK